MDGCVEGSHRRGDQIIGILKEHEAGVSVADLCRKHGVSDATVYEWKAKYGGMDVSEAKRLAKKRSPKGFIGFIQPSGPEKRVPVPALCNVPIA